MMTLTNKSQARNGISDTNIILESGPISRAYKEFDALRRVRDVRKCWRGRNMTLIHSVALKAPALEQKSVLLPEVLRNYNVLLDSRQFSTFVCFIYFTNLLLKMSLSISWLFNKNENCHIYLTLSYYLYCVWGSEKKKFFSLFYFFFGHRMCE